MGMRMSETRWAVFKRRAINPRDWCIWLVDLFECMMMHDLTNPKLITYSGTATNAWWNWQNIIECNWEWVSGHVGIEPALGISTKVARGVTRGWTSGGYEEWQSIRGRRQLRVFWKDPLQESWRITQTELQPVKDDDRLLTGHCTYNNKTNAKMFELYKFYTQFCHNSDMFRSILIILRELLNGVIKNYM
jgi:hypothetical protein